VIRVRTRGRKSEEAIDMTVGEEVIGEAEASDALLMGKEVDERTLHTQKVVDQVVEMVKEDPESSVNILRRWMDANQK
jgi:flagellar biosynthesis/type III secretory pathway M-ring protein FliF/YscJ